MFADARIEKIKELLLEYKHVDVNTLSSVLSASVATVRRDLERLEEEGFLRRTHGGAILIEKKEKIAKVAQEPYYREKKQIGIIAASLIKNNETVYIGAGRTCQQIARNLKDKRNVKVVTNNIGVITELLHTQSVRLMVPGGEIYLGSGSEYLSGQYALKNIANMYFQKSFFTVGGASIEGGYMVHSEEEAELCSLLMSHSNECVVVLDYSKFGQRSFTPLCPLTEIKMIVTNIEMPSEYKEYLYDNGVKVFTAIDDLY
jgi:DeoR family fructose operon transcriptional repressor